MNKLVILSVLQLGMCCAILYVLLNREGEPPTPTSEQPTINRAAALQAAPAVASTESLDAESIRQIVRSELSDFAAQLQVPATGQVADLSNIDPLERDARVSVASERLANILVVGEISDREIDEFQREISTLDLATQQAILSELFREINAGNVKVRN